MHLVWNGVFSPTIVVASSLGINIMSVDVDICLVISYYPEALQFESLLCISREGFHFEVF